MATSPEWGNLAEGLQSGRERGVEGVQSKGEKGVVRVQSEGERDRGYSQEGRGGGGAVRRGKNCGEDTVRRGER